MNEIHKKEFETVKNLAKEVDFFFPYNPKKPIFLQTDGLKFGLGYLLYQDGDKETAPAAEVGAETTKKKKTLGRRMVSMEATGLTPGQ